MGFMAAGMSLVWGYGGILSLGQAVFFGIGGYVFGIVGINMAAMGWPQIDSIMISAGLIAPLLLAFLFACVVFYARIRGVYVAIMILVITLLFQAFMNQTASRDWRIGSAHLGGNNGLGSLSRDVSTVPSLEIFADSSAIFLRGGSIELYYVILVLLVLTYLLLRYLVNSPFGFALTASREDPDRIEQIGYDVRKIQLITFCIGSMLAGLSGILYVSWGNFIEPSVFGVEFNIMLIIWVAVAGRKSIGAAMLGAVAVQWMSHTLASDGQYALVVLGALLIVSMIFFPDGGVSVPNELRRRTGQRQRYLGKRLQRGTTPAGRS